MKIPLISLNLENENNVRLTNSLNNIKMKTFSWNAKFVFFIQVYIECPSHKFYSNLTDRNKQNCFEKNNFSVIFFKEKLIC